MKKYQNFRRPYKNYSNSNWNWKEVFDEINNIKKNNQNFLEVVSKKYGIVYNTLKDKYHKYTKNKIIPKIKEERGKNIILTSYLENNIFEILKNKYINDNRPLNNNIIKEIAKVEFYNMQSIKFIFFAFYLFLSFTNIEVLITSIINIFFKFNTIKFKSSNFWCTKFKKRHNLSTQRAKASKISSKNIPIQKIDKFIKDSNRLFKIVGDSYFFNYDETNEKIANCPKTAIREKNSDSVKINCYQNLKENVTVGITESASGNFLTTFVVIKGRTKKSLKKFGNVPLNLNLIYSKSGWVTENEMILVLENILKFSNKKLSVLVLDRYPSHITTKVKEFAKNNKIILLFVPEGYTYKFQPLDVGINSIIKNKLTEKFTKFSVNNQFKKYSLEIFLYDLSESLNEIKKETIVKSFNCLIEH